MPELKDFPAKGVEVNQKGPMLHHHKKNGNSKSNLHNEI
jgi:hypothetical protein